MREAGAGPADDASARNTGARNIWAGDVTVIDIADPQAAPLTVNPLDPGPGQYAGLAGDP